MASYDYIITGAGAAGLSLLCRMVESPQFSQKKILLIDKGPKNKNDRTWCFWEKGPGFFEEIVYRKWDRLKFESNTLSRELQMDGYQYKMIRGIDFYNFCFQKIKQHPGVEIQYGELRYATDAAGKTELYLSNKRLDTQHAIIFNSIFKRGEEKSNTIYLQQHFKGWIVESPTDFFDPGTATLMDFRVHQRHGASFVYVLPLEANRALVEYTLFTENLLQQEEYDAELKYYIKEMLGLPAYRVQDVEFGSIPMTNAHFPFFKNGVYHIGTAGGQTKASTGYTFQFIQKQSRQLVEAMEKHQDLGSLSFHQPRFNFYDAVLLRVLANRTPPATEVFSRLFSRNRASSIFKFLDNETSLADELKIISSLQTLPFFKSALRQWM